MKLRGDLLSGGITLLITFNIFNILSFLYQILMARMLSVSDYGILATLFSIIYVLSVFSESIQTIMTKYSANQKIKGKLKNLAKRALVKGVFFGILFFSLYACIALFLTSVLEIDYWLLFLVGLFVPLFILMPINRGIMLGKERFKGLGINLIIEASLKVILAVFFVYAGMKVYGAIGGTIIAALFSFGLSFLILKDIFKAKEQRINVSNIYKYSQPVFIISTGILIFYSLDIIIAKAVFAPEIAGAYAIASVLAKSIFLVTQPISRAMFPLTAKNERNNFLSKNLLKNALMLLGTCLFIILVVFYFFSPQLITIFSGKEIAESTAVLFNLACAISILSVTNLILFYKLSRNTKSIISNKVLMLGVIVLIVMEAGILYSSFIMFSTLQAFANALIVASLIFLIATLALGRK